eukprot:CAMPEP_0117752294 /NCGR_PEP_ID=MMETSP0947-20121206/11521_1 /TAXON_ID=44440 /ORGANISM="Chattonella subsalsa, Strain CCMP2191" /LENGTH=350 /DNA_ID=CAMNT_0005570911 /DNA_START=45 /DNA_END=1097 /DNA_ORIENTATION=-
MPSLLKSKRIYNILLIGIAVISISSTMFCYSFLNTANKGSYPSLWKNRPVVHKRSLATVMQFERLLVNPEEVKKALTSSPQSLQLVDASWHLGGKRDAVAEFKAGRLPSAVFFDIDGVSDKNVDLPHMLPSEDLFAESVANLGISNDQTLVVYTTENCFSAARGWWTFKCFGHEKVHILNGGLPAWVSAGYEVESGDPEPKPKGSYKAKLNPSLVKDWKQVLEVVENKETETAQIVDARGAGRFLGTEPEPRAGLEGGHMPGAKNVPFAKLVAEGDLTTFKSEEEIKQIFLEAGVDLSADSPIITTCGSGVTASLLSFAMCLCGKEPASVPVYDGSWSEWGGNPELPKEK